MPENVYRRIDHIPSDNPARDTPGKTIWHQQDRAQKHKPAYAFEKAEQENNLFYEMQEHARGLFENLFLVSCN